MIGDGWGEGTDGWAAGTDGWAAPDDGWRARDDGWRVPDRGRRSRDELVRAGVDVLLDHGWTRLTVRRIAERAGVSPSLVVHHFGGVALLRRAVAHEVVAEMLTPLVRTITAARSWQAGVAAVLLQLQDDAERGVDLPVPGFDDLRDGGPPVPASRHVLADVVVASMEDAVVRDVVQDSLATTRRLLRDWWDDHGTGQDQADAAAVLVLALLDGLLLHRAVDPALPLRRCAEVLSGLPQASSAGSTSCSNSSMPLVSYAASGK